MLMVEKCKKDVNIHDAAGSINRKYDFGCSPQGAISKASTREGQLVREHERSSKLCGKTKPQDFMVLNYSSPQVSLSVTWPWVMRFCLVFVKILLRALKGTLPTTYSHDALEISRTPRQAGEGCWWSQNYCQLLSWNCCLNQIPMSSFRKVENSSLFMHPTVERKF